MADLLADIVDKINDYETSTQSFYDEANEYANFYRLIPTKKKRKNSLTQTVVSETTRAVETLATFWWTMQTAQEPNFQLIPASFGTRSEDIFAHTALLREQLVFKEYNEKLMEGLRSLALFGGMFIEEPFVDNPMNEIKYTDFRVKSIMDVAHDRTVRNINDASWFVSLNWVNKDQLLRMIRRDATETFDEQNIMDVLANAQDISSVPARIISRLSDAGYTSESYKNILELAIYHGEDEEYGDSICWVLNRQKIIRKFPNPFPKGRKNLRYVGFIKFDIEPFAYGVGKMVQRIQKDLNLNREMMQDLLLFNLLPILKVGRSAGLDYETLQAYPLAIWELDQPDSLQAINLNPQAIQYGLMMTKELKDELRGTSAAVDNLQAEVTEATATEVSLAANSAVRRVSAYGKVIAKGVLEKHIRNCINDNEKWINEPMWIHWTEKRPVEILPENIKKPVGARLRIVTDQDFRPRRLQRINESLQMYSSIRNTFPQEVIGRLDPIPFWEEAALELGIDPARVIKPVQQAGSIDPERLRALLGALLAQRGPQVAASPVGEAGRPSLEIGQEAIPS